MKLALRSIQEKLKILEARDAWLANRLGSLETFYTKYRVNGSNVHTIMGKEPRSDLYVCQSLCKNTTKGPKPKYHDIEERIKEIIISATNSADTVTTRIIMHDILDLQPDNILIFWRYILFRISTFLVYTIIYSG
jgi:hypothetical protein